MSLTLPLELLNKFKCNYFVETGTFHGEGVHKAISVGFANIYSIESYAPLYQECVKRYAYIPNVKIFFGDSAIFLTKMITNINEKITFWLDAHSNTTSPILQELYQIKKHPIKEHTILIDDVGLFGYPGGFKYIPRGLIIQKIKAINKDYIIEYADSLEVEGNILVAHV